MFVEFGSISVKLFPPIVKLLSITWGKVAKNEQNCGEVLPYNFNKHKIFSIDKNATPQ